MKTLFVGVIMSVLVAGVFPNAAFAQPPVPESHELATPLPSESKKFHPKFAQKGSVELGGSIGFQSIVPVTSGSTEEGITAFLITPHLGYFVGDGIEIGISPLGIQVLSGKTQSTTSINSHLALAYNGTTGNGLHPFIEGLLGFALQTSSYESSFGSSHSDSRSGLSFGGRAGIKYEVTSSVLLNVALQYIQTTLNGEKDTKRNGYNTLAIGLGFTVSL